MSSISTRVPFIKEQAVGEKNLKQESERRNSVLGVNMKRLMSAKLCLDKINEVIQRPEANLMLLEISAQEYC